MYGVFSWLLLCSFARLGWNLAARSTRRALCNYKGTIKCVCALTQARLFRAKGLVSICAQSIVRGR